MEVSDFGPAERVLSGESAEPPTAGRQNNLFAKGRCRKDWLQAAVLNIYKPAGFQQATPDVSCIGWIRDIVA